MQMPVLWDTPASEQKTPGWHGKQLLALLVALTGLYVPIGQGVGMADPAGQNAPRGHTKRAGKRTLWPGGQ